MSIEYIIRNSLLVPPLGLAVSYPFGGTGMEDLENKESHEMQYCQNGGVTGFVYQGKYYLVKGYGIAPALEELGFTESSFPVLLSCGETLMGPMTKAHWDALPEFSNH